MEFFIGLVVIIIIRALLSSGDSANSAPAPAPAPKPKPKSAPEPKPKSGNTPVEPSGSGQKPRKRSDVQDGILQVSRMADTWVPDGSPDDDGLPITHIRISGDIYVPYEDYPANVFVRLFDITESTDPAERFPVFCSINDLQDEHGAFEFATTLDIPYQSSSMDNYAICSIPDFDLVPAKRGRRRMIAYVVFSEIDDPDELITFGSLEFDMTFDRVGYLEWEEHALEQETHLVSVFVAASAVDGNIDKVEIDAVKQFFLNRYEGRDDAKKWKSKASEALKAAVGDIQEKRVTPGVMLTKAAKAIVAANEPEIARSAFEVALRAVAADGVVHPKEEKLLTKLATALQLEDKTVRNLRDRILKASMFEGAEDETALGMPAGLDDDGKRAWLSAEYGKWRGRVAHANPEIAAEATTRLERIAKLRTALG